MEIDEALSSLAGNLREERTRAGLTLEQVAQRSDLSTAHLSRLESGDRQPSVAALISLSRALGVSMSTLLGERRGVPAIGTSPPGRVTHEANGLTLAPCSGFPGSSTLEALQIRIEADRAPSEPARHRGEEWIYVVAGCLRLEFDGQVHLLQAGSTVHFDANRPHRLGAEQGAVDVLVVAADAPNDFRNHPLFSASISDH
jgi:transcriptional regulator with XRE-family HTH domain